MEAETEKLSSLIQNLEAIQKEVLHVGARMMSAANGAVYPTDMFMLAGVKKSVSTIRAFIDLTRNDNYITGAAILRIHIDSALRLFALTLVKDQVQFVSEVIASGKSVRTLRDHKGKLMTDAHLCAELSKFHPWIDEVYKQASGFVHLSDKHLYSILQRIDKDRQTISVLLDEKDGYIPQKNKEEATLAMIATSRLILEICESWTKFKNDASQNTKDG